jgi:hypothetical protein
VHAMGAAAVPVVGGDVATVWRRRHAAMLPAAALEGQLPPAHFLRMCWRRRC